MYTLPQEIKIQSGHRDIATLIGYIQHSPKRIRRSYERVFENDEIKDIISDEKNKVELNLSNEHYKKVAMQKYLDCEIDADTLHSTLTTLEDKKHNTKKSSDPSYV